MSPVAAHNCGTSISKRLKYRRSDNNLRMVNDYHSDIFDWTRCDRFQVASIVAGNGNPELVELNAQPSGIAEVDGFLYHGIKV